MVWSVQSVSDIPRLVRTVLGDNGLVMYYLFKSRTSVFHQEKKIYHKLNVLILETM